MEFSERCGQYVLVIDLPGDGASLIDGDIAVAVVSAKGDPGRRRATAAHELGHLVLGDEYSSDLAVHLSRADRESMINAFAAELLLPLAAFSGPSGRQPTRANHSPGHHVPHILVTRPQTGRAGRLAARDGAT